MNLKTWMKQNRYRDRDLAEEFKVSITHINELKNRRAEPSLRLAIKINVFTLGDVSFGEMTREESTT